MARVTKKTSTTLFDPNTCCFLEQLPLEVRRAWEEDQDYAQGEGYDLGPFSSYLHDMLLSLIEGLHEIALGVSDPQETARQALLHGGLPAPKEQHKKMTKTSSKRSNSTTGQAGGRRRAVTS